MTDFDIEVVPLSDRLTHFYWGRNLDHANFNMRVGGGNHVIHQGDSAIVIDTMCIPGQGQWVKDYMTATHGIENFTVVSTHWHSDHVVDNAVFPHGRIVGHSLTRALMLEHKHSLENSTAEGSPAFQVVPPSITFEGRMDLWLDDLKVELHEFGIHERGHIAVVIPDDKTLIAADMLEDPICVMKLEHLPAEFQLREFERMMTLDVDHIYATHCTLETVKAGGYDKRFIENMAGYMAGLMADAALPESGSKPPQAYIADALDSNELTWWAAYEEVHQWNREAVRNAAKA
jgi:cyclase